MKIYSVQRLGAVVVGASLSLVLAGCVSTVPTSPTSTSGSSSEPTQVAGGTRNRPVGNDEFLNAGRVAQEYLAETKKIPDPLPPKASYPPGIPKSFGEAENSLFQRGLGKAQAWHTWLCAWQDTYLDSQSGSSLRTEAESMIARWPDTAYFHDYVKDPTGAWAQWVIQPMELGDPSGVQESRDQLCEHYPYLYSGSTGS